jgi:hypothetical protein
MSETGEFLLRAHENLGKAQKALDEAMRADVQEGNFVKTAFLAGEAKGLCEFATGHLLDASNAIWRAQRDSLSERSGPRPARKS